MHRAKQKIVDGRGPSNINVSCSFDVSVVGLVALHNHFSLLNMVSITMERTLRLNHLRRN